MTTIYRLFLYVQNVQFIISYLAFAVRDIRKDITEPDLM